MAHNPTGSPRDLDEDAPPATLPQLSTSASAAGVGESAVIASDYANSVDLILANRVARTQRRIDAGQPVTDDELLQHREDARLLMEMTHDRWLISHEPSDLALCRRWMERRDEAVRLLSPAWRAAREAQIRQEIANGTGCYFMDAGKRDRQAANEEGRG